MKRHLFVIAALALVSFVSDAKADLIFSTSSTDAAAGSDFSANVGDEIAVYVWLSTPDLVLTVAQFNVDSDNSSIAAGKVDGISGANGWGEAVDYTPGSLYSDGAMANFGGGTNTGGSDNFVLLGTFLADATAVGTSNLSFSNTVMLDELDNDVTNQFDFGTGTLTVAAAVPEPSTFGLLSLGTLGLIAYRRRRTAKAKSTLHDA